MPKKDELNSRLRQYWQELTSELTAKQSQITHHIEKIINKMLSEIDTAYKNVFIGYKRRKQEIKAKYCKREEAYDTKWLSADVETMGGIPLFRMPIASIFDINILEEAAYEILFRMMTPKFNYILSPMGMLNNQSPEWFYKSNSM